jgi:hypothetical protein
VRKVCIGLAALLLGLTMVSEATALDAYYWNVLTAAGHATVMTWSTDVGLRARDVNGQYFRGYWTFPNYTLLNAYGTVLIDEWYIRLYRISNGVAVTTAAFFWPGPVPINEIGPADSAKVSFRTAASGAAGANTVPIIVTGAPGSAVTVLGN